MKIICFDFIIIALLVLSGGCRKKAAPPSVPSSANPIEMEHAKAVEEGYKSIDFAASIRSQFRAFSSIQNFKHVSLPQTWQTMFYVNGRYEMVLQVPINYDAASGGVRGAIEKSELHIFEISSVISDNNVYHVRYRGRQRILSYNNIKELAGDGWNFKKIGILPEAAKIPNLEDYIQSWGDEYPDQRRWLKPRVSGLGP